MEEAAETAKDADGDMATGMETETEAVEMTETATMKMSHWKKAVALVQAVFQEGWLVEEAT